MIDGPYHYKKQTVCNDEGRVVDTHYFVADINGEAMTTSKCATRLNEQEAEIKRLRAIEAAALAYIEKWNDIDSTGLFEAFCVFAKTLGYRVPTQEVDCD